MDALSSADESSESTPELCDGSTNARYPKRAWIVTVRVVRANVGRVVRVSTEPCERRTWLAVQVLAPCFGLSAPSGGQRVSARSNSTVNGIGLLRSAGRVFWSWPWLAYACWQPIFRTA